MATQRHCPNQGPRTIFGQLGLRGQKIGFTRGIEETVLRNGFRKLPITAGHAEHAGGLPQHHRDLFDRMLIAQAALEKMALRTQDERMRPYSVPTIGLR